MTRQCRHNDFIFPEKDSTSFNAVVSCNEGSSLYVYPSSSKFLSDEESEYTAFKVLDNFLELLNLRGVTQVVSHLADPKNDQPTQLPLLRVWILAAGWT